MQPALDTRPLILIPHQTGSNHYIGELGKAYQRAGWRVVFGSDNLMLGDVGADLVHLHWPEEHYRWCGEGAPAHRAEHLRNVVATLRARGTPIAMTVHNLAPHEHFRDPLDRGIYQFLFEQVQLLHHHCAESQAALAAQYRLPATLRHVVVPHGHYGSYASTVDRGAARAKLGIGEADRVYLHFGQMRGYKGMDVLHRAFELARVPRKHLVLAGRYRQEPGWMGRLAYARLRLRHRWSPRFSFYGVDIPSDDIQLYLLASDCLVLGHTVGLNSGVAVLGMSFGRRVVGPRLGCIEWVLSQGDNLHYPVGDAEALARCMEQAARCADSHSARNAEIAAAWRWDDISGSVLEQLSG